MCAMMRVTPPVNAVLSSFTKIVSSPYVIVHVVISFEM